MVGTQRRELFIPGSTIFTMVFKLLFGVPEEKPAETRFNTCAYAMLARSPKCTNSKIIAELAHQGYGGSTMTDLPIGYCQDCKLYGKKN